MIVRPKGLAVRDENARTITEIDREESRTYVNIKKVEQSPGSKGCRGLLSSGGWITLQKQRARLAYTQKIPVGCYKVCRKIKLTTTCNPECERKTKKIL